MRVTYKLVPCAFASITHEYGCLDQVSGVFSEFPYVGPILVRQDPHSFQQECKNVDRPRARRISY